MARVWYLAQEKLHYRKLQAWQSIKDVALTNTNRQPLRVVPRTSHSALVHSTLALLVTAEVETYWPTTTSSVSIHLIPAVVRHQFTLWVVPLYWSGHWSCGLQTGHIRTHPNGQRHHRWRVKQASSAILQVSSRRCSEKEWQEEEQERHWIIVCNMWCFRLACGYVQDSSEQPDQRKTQLAISRSIAISYRTRSDSLSNVSREPYHNRRRAESVVERQSMPSRRRRCPRKCEGTRHFRTQWRTSSCLPDRFESHEHEYCMMMTLCYITDDFAYLCTLFKSIRPGTELGCSSLYGKLYWYIFVAGIQNTRSKINITYFVLLGHKLVWWKSTICSDVSHHLHSLHVGDIYNMFAIMNLLFSYIHHWSEWHCQVTQLVKSTNTQGRARQ